MIGIIAINYEDIIIDPTLPILGLKSITDITATTATSGGIIYSEGGTPIIQKGVCWATTPWPTLENGDHYTDEGANSNEFTSYITGLVPDTTFFIRAYAANSGGINYTDQVSFKTIFNNPTVETNSISSITFNSCIVNSTISGNDIGMVSERGVCWSTTINPSIYSNSNNNGNGIGTYNISLINLSENTLYYVRAYCVTPKGIFYGNPLSVNTNNVSVGDYYNGGTVAAIFTTPQNGYKGIIMKRRWLNDYGSVFVSDIFYRTYSSPLVPFRDGLCSTEINAGYGKIGTQAMLNAYNYHHHASDGIAVFIWELGTDGEYWHMPTLLDLDEVFKNKVILGLDTFPSGSNYNWYATCSAAQTTVFEPSKFYEYNIQGRPGYQNPWEAHNRDNKIIYSTLSIKYF